MLRGDLTSVAPNFGLLRQYFTLKQTQFENLQARITEALANLP